MHGVPACGQPPWQLFDAVSKWQLSGMDVVVEMVVVLVVVVAVGQAMPRGCPRHLKTNLVGLAPSVLVSVIFRRCPTGTGTIRSEHATSPHTLIANVQTPSH